jgi:hypothetical protein
MNLGTACKITFASPGTEPLLGAIAMEDLGVIVDPRTQTLREVKTKERRRTICN